MTAGRSEIDHLLIVLWDPEPEAQTEELRQRFSYIKVNYFCLKNCSKALVEESSVQAPGSFNAARYVFNELLSSRKFDSETARSREILIGML